MPDLSHLTDHAENNEETPTVSSLEEVTAYSEALIEKRAELKIMEADAKAKKKEVLKLEQELLPQALLSIGLQSIQLRSGETVSVKEDMSCSVKDYSKLYDFLEEQGDDALMKTSIEVGKLPQNILNMILKEMKDTYDIDATSQLYIHPSTLKAYFKRLCGIGEGVEAKVPLASIDEEMLGTFTFYKVAVKKAK